MTATNIGKASTGFSLGQVKGVSKEAARQREKEARANRPKLETLPLTVAQIRARRLRGEEQSNNRSDHEDQR